MISTSTQACAWSAVLTEHGYEVETVVDAETAPLPMADLFILGIGSIDLCRRIRAVSKAPIVVVSPCDEEAAKVNALDAGADDYVTIPFGVDELMARIRALLRRPRAETVASAFRAGDFRVDFDARRVEVCGTAVRLTPKEFDLVVYLVRHEGLTISHKSLLRAVWGEASVEQTQYLRVFVGQLRKKLEPVRARPRYLLTERWVGYRLVPQGHQQP